jgi:hypothetical protein
MTTHKFTLQQLEENYQSVTFGYDEPTHLRVSTSMLKEFKAFIVAHNARWMHVPPKPEDIFRFNNCVVVEGKDLASDFMEFVNIDKLHNPKLQVMFRVPEVTLEEQIREIVREELKRK